jgi:hypothetical protein
MWPYVGQFSDDYNSVAQLHHRCVAVARGTKHTTLSHTSGTTGSTRMHGTADVLSSRRTSNRHFPMQTLCYSCSLNSSRCKMAEYLCIILCTVTFVANLANDITKW